MTTFVMVIWFWEVARGYAVTTIPGYESRAACEAAITELKSPASYNKAVAVCVRGPAK